MIVLDGKGYSNSLYQYCALGAEAWSHNLNNAQGRIWGRIQEVGFLSFVHKHTPILPKTEAVEIMFQK
jgi:hypothetical protein